MDYKRHLEGFVIAPLEHFIMSWCVLVFKLPTYAFEICDYFREYILMYESFQECEYKSEKRFKLVRCFYKLTRFVHEILSFVHLLQLMWKICNGILYPDDTWIAKVENKIAHTQNVECVLWKYEFQAFYDASQYVIKFINGDVEMLCNQHGFWRGQLVAGALNKLKIM